MKVTIDINGKPVQIELTKEQIKQAQKQVPVTDRIKSFADACAEMDINEDDFNRKYGHLDKDTIAYERLKIITDALNEGPLDAAKPWWYPVFNRRTGAGFGLSLASYDFWYSLAAVGERLCFKNSELARYAGTQFAAIYRDYILR